MKKEIEGYCIECGKKISFYTKLDSEWAKIIKPPSYCSKCYEIEAERRETEKSGNKRMERFSRSGIMMSYDSFFSFKPKKLKTQKKAIEEIEKLSSTKEFTRLPFFYGSPGTGKTFLSIYLAQRCIKELDTDVVYLNIPALMEKLRVEHSVMDYSSRIMILDDIGAHNISSWTLEKLYNIVDYRLAKKLPTMITSNIEPFSFSSHVLMFANKDVPKTLCDALEDRMILLTKPVKLEGESLRIKKALEEI